MPVDRTTALSGKSHFQVGTVAKGDRLAELRPSRRRFRMADGIELVADAWGDPANPPALLLYAGGQTRHAWRQAAPLLAQRSYYEIAVDQRATGCAPWLGGLTCSANVIEIWQPSSKHGARQCATIYTRVTVVGGCQ